MSPLVYCAHLRIGIDPAGYAGHSFRRGGATLFFSTTKNEDLLKVMGDWRSTAYQLYITVDVGMRVAGAVAMATAALL